MAATKSAVNRLKLTKKTKANKKKVRENIHKSNGK